jgi:hypothetical protein
MPLSRTDPESHNTDEGPKVGVAWCATDVKNAGDLLEYDAVQTLDRLNRKVEGRGVCDRDGVIEEVGVAVGHGIWSHPFGTTEFPLKLRTPGPDVAMLLVSKRQLKKLPSGLPSSQRPFQPVDPVQVWMR